MPEFGVRAVKAHHGTHEDGGTDEINVQGLSGELADNQKSIWTKVSGKPTLWELVEKGYLTTAATTVTISNLDGDTAELYHFVLWVKNDAGVNVQYSLRPNGLEVGATYQWVRGLGSTPGSASDWGPAFWLWGAGADRTLFIDMIFNSKTGRVRIALVHVYDSYPQIVMIGHPWSDTVTNITSLVLHSTAADGLGVGTFYALFKLAS